MYHEGAKYYCKIPIIEGRVSHLAAGPVWQAIKQTSGSRQKNVNKNWSSQIYTFPRKTFALVWWGLRNGRDIKV